MRGFTLIEILLALAISAIILTLVYGTFAQTSSVTGKVEEEATIYHQARLILGKMPEELVSAYWKSENPSTIFRGTADSLTFTSLSRASSRFQYYLEPAGEDGFYLLMHLEDTNIYNLSNRNQEIYTFGEGLAGFNLRYYDGREWVDEWDANILKKLPQAVEIKIKFKDGRNRERMFSTVVEIPLGKNK